MTGIYYFSGTGNCLAIAKQLKTFYSDARTVKITRGFSLIKREIHEDNTIVIYPSYAYGMPEPLYGFFENSRITSGYTAVIVSYGSSYGASLSHAKRALKNQGLKADFYGGVKSPENYLPLFGIKNEEELAALIENQALQTYAIAEKLLRKEKNDIKIFKPFSDFVSFIFRKATPFLNGKIKVSDKCTRCGICEKVCPTGAMVMTDGQNPKVSAKICAHCQSCINACPVRAVMFPGLKKLDRRYLHPDVSIKELGARADIAECRAEAEDYAPEAEPVI